MANNPDRQLLQHFLASIAYHAQKGIRSAPSGYWTFSAGNRVRTPESILRHMTGLLGYARTFWVAGSYNPEALPNIQAEIDRFHHLISTLERAVVKLVHLSRERSMDRGATCRCIFIREILWSIIKTKLMK